jgi:hypothetical protein
VFVRTRRSRPQLPIRPGRRVVRTYIAFGMPGGGSTRPECGEKNALIRPSRRTSNDGLLWSSRPSPRFTVRTSTRRLRRMKRATLTSPPRSIQPV